MTDAARPLPSTRSDELRAFAELLESQPHLRQLVGGVPRFLLVVDSSVAIGVMIWLARTRKNPTARTELQEIAASGIVDFVAPLEMTHEVIARIPTLASEEGIPVDRLSAAWVEIEPLIRFLPVQALGDEEFSRDPLDRPFIVLRRVLSAAAVVSKDKDFAGMGCPVLEPADLKILRDLARARASQLGITIPTAFAFSILLAVAMQVLAATKSLPIVLRLALAALGVFLIFKVAQRLLNSKAGPALVEILSEVGRRKQTAEKLLRRASEKLPPAETPELESAAFAVLVAARVPLSTVQIEGRLRSGGFPTRLKSLARGIRVGFRGNPAVAYERRRWKLVEG